MYNIHNSSKLRYLLKGMNKLYFNNFKSDEVGLYSLTKFTQAQHITAQLCKICNLNKDSVILDTCACVGGSAISFALRFKQCICLEIDKIRYNLLVNNTKYFTNIISYNMDCLIYIKNIINALVEEGKIKKENNKLIKTTDYYKYDLVFMDPPWGGIDYKQNKIMSLYLDEININKFIELSLLLSKYVSLRVPYNYNFNDLIDFNIYYMERIFTAKDSFYYFIVLTSKK